MANLESNLGLGELYPKSMAIELVKNEERIAPSKAVDNVRNPEWQIDAWTKLNHVGKVYHLRARRQMAESEGQVAKFNRRYQLQTEENVTK